MKINYKIRKTKITDIDQVVDAHVRSIKEICSRDYSPEEIKAFANVKYSMDIWKKSVLEDFHTVVEIADRIEGFCHAKVHSNNKGEIAGLYFTPAITGKGIARESFKQAMEYLKQNQVKRVFITGTKTAKGFYEKMEFSVIEKTAINIRGTDLECYKMERLID